MKTMKNNLWILRLFLAALVIWAAQSNYIAKAADSMEPNQATTEDLRQQEALEDVLIKARFKEVDLVTLLRLIARKTGDSIIIDGDVKGKVSIDFNGVKPEEALESILDIGQLEMVKRGRVMGKLIEKLDVPQKQVMIEAAIMEVSLDDETKLGVNLAAILNSANLNAPNLTVQGLGFAADPTTLPNPEGLFGEGKFFLGKSDRSIDALIEALQTVTDTTVLSHPKILSVSGQEAEIIVGQKLGFRVTTTTQTITTETIQFLEVGTQLKFTPFITENNDVIMDIHPEVSDGSISEDGLPSENTT